VLPTRKILTMYAPLGGAAPEIENILRRVRDTMGAKSVWISADGLPDLHVWGEFPEEEEADGL
jgi:hypothetical protein